MNQAIATVVGTIQQKHRRDMDSGKTISLTNTIIHLRAAD
jgi:hypothetical protein